MRRVSGIKRRICVSIRIRGRPGGTSGYITFLFSLSFVVHFHFANVCGLDVVSISRFRSTDHAFFAFLLAVLAGLHTKY